MRRQSPARALASSSGVRTRGIGESSTDDGETLWIVDGLHRLDAHRKAQRAASPKVTSIRASDDDNPA
jgi:hypothetical protein